jgi:mannonate dehydratase
MGLLSFKICRAGGMEVQLRMKMTFRWFGKDDPITLEKIRQIPCMTGIVTAVYDVPAGEIWPAQSIASLKSQALNAGLAFEVIESVPVHEDIKLGAPGSAKLIDNYCENIRRLGAAGVKVICYNFMPVFDWTRSDLKHPLRDGSNSLSYDSKTISGIDPVRDNLSLPGWDESYSRDALRLLISRYADITEEKLWHNFGEFLSAVIPACEEAGVKMAIHPDDPPWGIFGLPRIITGEKSYERLFELNKNVANGITFCTGSLGANPENDLPAMIRKFGERIHFVHARNVLYTGDHSFQETAHPTSCGSLDMYAILRALRDIGFEGYIRPDHGRMIWGEQGRPGYGLYDRALGAAYLTGLWEGIIREEKA